jgi:ATP-dependent RNA helicase RhlB
LITFIKRKIKSLFEEKSVNTSSKTPSHHRATAPKKNESKEFATKQNYKQQYKKKKYTTPKKQFDTKKTVYSKPHRKNTSLRLPTLIDILPEEDEMRFADFPLKKEILCGLQDAEFKYCTPIQEKCLPHLLKNKDIAGKAQTGTGKTAAFLISIFTYLLNNPAKMKSPGYCRALIIAPTRELAIQIYEDAEVLGKYCGFSNAVVYGGMDYQKQQMSLQKHIDILVGTPGRLLDYSRNRVLKLMKTEIFVIDEADRMLDMGFIPDVRKITSQLPQPVKRQTMLFSATLSEDIMRLVKRWQIDPVMIEIEPEQIVTDLIEQICYSVSQDDKKNLLLWLLNNDNVKKALIFVNRRDFTVRIKTFLERYNHRCDILSGDVPQKKRLRMLEGFRDGTIPIIIATDVASRGIHVDDITHVINYDLPDKPEDYIHRIGRTGRAGRKGKAISFICEYGAYIIPELETILETEIKSIQPKPEMLAYTKPPRGTHYKK